MSREVPEGWQLGKLGPFVEEFKVLDSAGDLPPLSVTKSSGIVFQSAKFNKRIANASSSNYKVVRSGEYSYDPMSLYYGAIGRLSVCDAGIVSPAYITFRLKGAIEKVFFDLYVKTSDFLVEVNKVTTGGNQDGKRKKTDWNSFCCLPILLPPIHEQRRIAEILSSVDEAIAATRAVIEQTRKVKQGVLERLLTKGIGHTRFKQTEIGEIPEGWEVVELQDVASVRTGLAKNKKEIPDAMELPYLRVANVQDGYVDLSDLQTISVSRSQVERYSLRKGDVLMTEGGDYDKLGRGDVWDGSVEPCLHQNHVFAVRAHQERLIPEFLANLTASRSGKAYFQSCSKRSTNLASINSTQVKQFPVRLPDLREQSEIVRISRSFDVAISVGSLRLSQQLQMKSALMSDLLTGRKRVTDALPMAAE